jgi:hypothetical protein
MTSIEEAQSLKGNVVFHPSFVTPHDYPTFLRSAVCRVVAGAMLLSGILTAICAIVTDVDASKEGCAIATGVSIVAYYHYSKLISIREQSGTRIKLAKPGDVPSGQASELKVAWQDMSADAVRYSDWLVSRVPKEIHPCKC